VGELTDCHRPVRTGLGGGWRGTRCSPPWHLVESPILEMRVAHHGPGIAAETVPGRNSRTDSRVRTGSKNRICIGIRNCSGVRPAVRLSLPLVRLSRPLLMSCAAQGGSAGGQIRGVARAIRLSAAMAVPPMLEHWRRADRAGGPGWRPRPPPPRAGLLLLVFSFPGFLARYPP
jgi:hypothetical protein